MPSLQDLSTILDGMQIVDLSPLLYTNMPRWPSNPDLLIVEDARNYAQHGSFAQTLILPEHSGCHVDAPPHQHPELAQQTIDTFPITALMGIAKKLDLCRTLRSWGTGAVEQSEGAAGTHLPHH